MWPDVGSDFEPSAYSPAGQLQRDARIMANLRDSPGATLQALRGSWGLRILAGGIFLVALVSVLAAVL